MPVDSVTVDYGFSLQVSNATALLRPTNGVTTLAIKGFQCSCMPPRNLFLTESGNGLSQVEEEVRSGPPAGLAA